MLQLAGFPLTVLALILLNHLMGAIEDLSEAGRQRPRPLSSPRRSGSRGPHECIARHFVQKAQLPWKQYAVFLYFLNGRSQMPGCR